MPITWVPPSIVTVAHCNGLSYADYVRLCDRYDGPSISEADYKAAGDALDAEMEATMRRFDAEVRTETFHTPKRDKHVNSFR